ncbi:MAG: DUF1702 family protein, partial [Planctomycetes bacterium]|nr:DUF1702 family protein [Planctomycetota bacterium]
MESRRAWWVRAALVRTFGLPPREVTCARRGFAVDDPAIRARLEGIGAVVVAGQRLALEVRAADALGLELERTIAREDRGFANEGAALGLELLDRLLPGRGGRWSAFARGAGAPHAYLLHVG